MSSSSQFRNLNQMCFEEFLLKCHRDVHSSRIKFRDEFPPLMESSSLSILNEILPYLGYEEDRIKPDGNLARFLLLRSQTLDNSSSHQSSQLSRDILRDARMALRSGHLKASECWRASVLILRYSQQPSLLQPEINFFLENVEIGVTSEKGRSLFAKRALPIGTLISSEKPLVAFIHAKGHNRSYCGRCFRTTFNPLPCPECNHTVFCSLECLRDPGSHHYYECQMGLDGILEKLCPKTTMPLGKVLILRLITQRPLSFFKERGYYVTEDIDTSRLPEECGGEPYDSLWDKIRIINEAPPPRKELSFMEAFFFLLRKTTDYFINADSSDLDGVLGLMRHYEAIVDGNSFTLEEFRDSKRVLGSSLYDYSSFYNHSCNPNACFVFDPCQRLTVVATSHIFPGEEVCISYGPLVWNMSADSRRAKMANYNFICSCPPCIQQISPGEDNDPRFDEELALQQQPPELLRAIARGDFDGRLSQAKLKNIVHLCAWFLYGQ